MTIILSCQVLYGMHMNKKILKTSYKSHDDYVIMLLIHVALAGHGFPSYYPLLLIFPLQPAPSFLGISFDEACP